MPEHNKKYDEKAYTCTEDNKKSSTKVFSTLKYLGVGLIFSTLTYFVVFSFIDTPKEIMLQREIEQYDKIFHSMNEEINDINKVLKDIQLRDTSIYRLMLKADPVSGTFSEGGIGGRDVSQQYEGLSNKDILTEINSKIDVLTSKVKAQEQSLGELYGIAVDKDKQLSCIPAIKPVRDLETRRIASYYGYRVDPIYKVRRFHKGIDFSAPIGTEIVATGDGKVTEVHKGASGGYGRHVEIDHGYEYSTLYAHMHKIIVKEGQQVKRGQVIGYVGNSGKSSGPHLHYEVKKNGSAINPINFFYNDITPEEYEEMLRIAAQPGQSMD